MYRPLRDYALIGDCQSAALISSEASIDWLCLPRFDSPAIFLRLLDDQKGGFCALEPAQFVKSSRAYVPGTNVLETMLTTRTGQLLVTDFMPINGSPEPSRAGQDTLAGQRVIRMLRCSQGNIEVTVHVRPTFNFARDTATFHAESPSAITARSRNDALHVALEGHELHANEEGSIRAAVRLRAGDQYALVLTWTPASQRLLPMSLAGAAQALARTHDYWRQWARGCAYEGDYRELLLRSALVLKLMTFEPTGAIVAAPTTSLPEAIGAARNWDYRFCWLRDATFTLIALMNLGYFGEARDFLRFLQRSLGARHEFQVLYTIERGREAREQELRHLDGYRGSRPVRVGNAAIHQEQLDIFGELIHCVYLYTAHPETEEPKGTPPRMFWPVVEAAANFVAAHWREPDNGIWEMRGHRRQFVYSKGSCWLALDRAVRLARHFRVKADLRRWAREREALYQSFNDNGFNPRVGAFVQSYGSSHLDAAVLRLPLMGAIDARDPRMLSTIAQVERRLMRDGVVYRYRSDDRLKGDEGTFAACGFWLADNYVLSGRLEDARRLFEHLVSFANDVGLLSEEIQPESGELLGNFPQAFTHIALINAGIRLSFARQGHKSAAHAVAEEQVELIRKVA